jgi:hypothetical protein
MVIRRRLKKKFVMWLANLRLKNKLKKRLVNLQVEKNLVRWLVSLYIEEVSKMTSQLLVEEEVG